MARGFDSKSVADQQESAEQNQGRRAPAEGVDPETAKRRRRLELARADVLNQLRAARAEAHKEMLRRGLEALDKELGQLR